MNLIFSDKVKTNQLQFSAKVRHIADLLHIDANWLMYVMWFESGLNEKAQNWSTNATGLIQFMPSTSVQLGTTTADLMQMSNVEQLDYVYSYLLPYAGKINNLTDLYLAVFFPAAIGRSADYIFETSSLSRSKIASQNPTFDLNSDGMITYNEVETKILAGYPEEIENEKKNFLNMKITSKEITIIIAVASIVIAISTIYKELRTK